MNGPDTFTAAQFFEIKKGNDDHEKRNGHGAGAVFSHKLIFLVFVQMEMKF